MQYNVCVKTAINTRLKKLLVQLTPLNKINAFTALINSNPA